VPWQPAQLFESVEGGMGSEPAGVTIKALAKSAARIAHLDTVPDFVFMLAPVVFFILRIFV
jgi:hypothetical protein